MAYLEIKNLKKSFGYTAVLNGIDLDLNKGEVLSLIGSSGSGKTTLLRCVNFLETPHEGTMTLDGELLLDASAPKRDSDKILREKRLNFGLVFQSFNLFPQYTVLKNVMLAPTLLLKDKAKAKKAELKATGLSSSEIRKELAEFKRSEKEKIERESLEMLATVDLTDKKDSYPCELSGGQCQRVAIARALALKPKVLCFDEPTSALDPELTVEVLKVIKSLKNEDRTMIIVTHEMGFAKSVSDKVVFMSGGYVTEVGTPEEIFDHPSSPELQAFLASASDKDEI